jgi:hypothetical protein
MNDATGLSNVAKLAEFSKQAADKKAQPAQAEALVDLAHDAELFHAPDGEAYAVIPVTTHRETWPIRHKRFRQWLIAHFYQEREKPPGAQAVADALTTLEAKAQIRGPEWPVFTRVAHADGAVYLDLTSQSWQVIEITAAGWRLLDQSPVRFRRMNGMRVLPSPIRGGSIEELREFLNLQDDNNWRLLVGWLIGALRPTGPYPVLVLQGEQGSAKSTLARLLRLLIDPSLSPLRTMPPGERDLMIAAVNAWVLSFDNLSGLPRWFSDALCRLSTGGGFAMRELYTNSEEIILDAQRPIILNGIDDLAVRQDLIDRSIVLNLPPIPENERSSESELWVAFESARPRILGALCTAVSSALANQDNVRLHAAPRMADFAKWVAAASPAFGWPERAFLDAYVKNRRAATELGMDASPIAGLIRTMVDQKQQWTGTATKLLDELCKFAGESEQRSRAWPKTPQTLSRQLRRLNPAFRMIGVEIESHREPNTGRRLITLKRTDQKGVTCVTGVQGSDRSDDSDDLLRGNS